MNVTGKIYSQIYSVTGRKFIELNSGYAIDLGTRTASTWAVSPNLTGYNFPLSIRTPRLEMMPIMIGSRISSGSGFFSANVGTLSSNILSPGYAISGYFGTFSFGASNFSEDGLNSYNLGSNNSHKEDQLSLNLGFGNSISGSAQVTAEGLNNYINNSTSFNVVGQANSVDLSTSSFLIGSLNTLNEANDTNVIGEYNSITLNDQSQIFGKFNTISGNNNLSVFGDQNTINNSSQSVLFGSINTSELSDNNLTFGNSNSFNSASANLTVGNSNNISNQYNSTFGSSNVVNGSYSEVYGQNNLIYNEADNNFIIGDNNIASGAVSSTVLGSNNIFAKKIDDTNNGTANFIVGDSNTSFLNTQNYIVGAGNNIKNGTLNFVFGNQNDSNGANSSYVFGESNRASGIRNYLIGNNNESRTGDYNSVIIGLGYIPTGDNKISSTIIGGGYNAIEVSSYGINLNSLSTPTINNQNIIVESDLNNYLNNSNGLINSGYLSTDTFQDPEYDRLSEKILVDSFLYHGVGDRYKGNFKGKGENTEYSFDGFFVKNPISNFSGIFSAFGDYYYQSNDNKFNIYYSRALYPSNGSWIITNVYDSKNLQSCDGVFYYNPSTNSGVFPLNGWIATGYHNLTGISEQSPSFTKTTTFTGLFQSQVLDSATAGGTNYYNSYADKMYSSPNDYVSILYGNSPWGNKWMVVDTNSSGIYYVNDHYDGTKLPQTGWTATSYGGGGAGVPEFDGPDAPSLSKTGIYVVLGSRQGYIKSLLPGFGNIYIPFNY
jgi:hypothetical protein